MHLFIGEPRFFKLLSGTISLALVRKDSQQVIIDLLLILSYEVAPCKSYRVRVTE